jgi:hypothetical protein
MLHPTILTTARHITNTATQQIPTLKGIRIKVRETDPRSYCTSEVIRFESIGIGGGF